MTMPNRIIGLGAGGHAKVVIELLRAIRGFEVVGLLDARVENTGRVLLDVPILGDDSLLPELAASGVGHFFVGVGGVKNTAPRRRAYERALGHGLHAPILIHPASVVSSSATLDSGATIMAGAIVCASASIGANVIINTGAIVEHDCSIGAHVHIATGARLAGAVRVEPGAHVGAGATIKQGICIGEGAVVGAGAVVVKNVAPGMVVVGVPARPLQIEG
jgi:sugar O-acyltransferase (sialic acid O-acetyltransferase NeuD family)